MSASAYGRCPFIGGLQIQKWPGPQTVVRLQEVSASGGSTVVPLWGFVKYGYDTAQFGIYRVYSDNGDTAEGPVHTYPDKFENATHFFWIGLPPSRIRWICPSAQKQKFDSANLAYPCGWMKTETFENADVMAAVPVHHGRIVLNSKWRTDAWLSRTSVQRITCHEI